MERINPRSRSDAYGKRINRAHSPLLAYTLPYLSIVIGSLLPILPIATAVPLVPPLGFMALVAWRMVRPGLLPVWAGFPLGFIDDLFSGQPFGSAMLLWSLAMIGIEIIETRFPWRSFVLDWMTSSAIIAAYIFLAAVFSGANVSAYLLAAIVPQVLLAALLYPIISRSVASMDRFRLMRVKVVG